MIKLVKHPSFGGNFCKQMHLDNDRKLLMCRMMDGIVYFLQLFRPPNEASALIVEMMEHYKDSTDKTDGLSRICWLPKLNCYCDGTRYGIIRVRTMTGKGECLLQVKTGLNGKVRLMLHDKSRHLMFLAGSDGQLIVWKLPAEWQPTWLDQRLREIRLQQGA
jgi:hypothetical protein